MATSTRAHTIVNPSRRHLSAKQIRAGFGGKRRQSALRHAKAHKRNVAKPKANAVARRARPSRQNPGEILSLTLGNPGGVRRKGNMAKAQKKNAAPHRASGVKKRNPARQNPHRKHHYKHHLRRHNPSGMGNIPNLATDGLFTIGGLVASRLLTQMILGANNVGLWGYVGNAAATAAVATAAHMVSKNPRMTNALIVGGAAGIVARLFQDFTPFGAYLQRAGVGDYAGGGAHGVGLYLPSNAVVPQRYVDANNSALVQIPAGWGGNVINSSGAPVEVTAGVGLYGGESLY